MQKEYLIGAARLDSTGEKFSLHTSSAELDREPEGLCSVRNPLSIPTVDYLPGDYRVALFTHPDWPESLVLSLKQNKKSAGLAFSLQALATGSTVLQGNKTWNDYGFLSLWKLCAGDTCSHVGSRGGGTHETYDITELFTEDTVVAIFMKSVCELTTDSEQEFVDYLFNRLPSFVRLGLFLQLYEGSRRVRRYKRNDLLNELAAENRYINLLAVNRDFPISSKQFLKDLLLLIDPYEDHPAFRFFLYYQLIESLLQNMYEKYYSEFIGIVTNPKFNRATTMKDLIETLQSSLGEKNRLRTLVNANVKEFSALKDQCIAVLEALSPSAPPPPPEPAPAVGAPVVPEAAPGVVAAPPPPPEPAPAVGAAVVPEAAPGVVAAPPPPPEPAPAVGAAVVPEAAPGVVAAPPPPPEPAPAVGAAVVPEAAAAVVAAPAADPATVLYSVRNLLFHNFSRMATSDGDLEDLVDEFSRTICELALNFRPPTISLKL